MRKTGGDKRRRVKMRIIDCLCKQFFLIANHILNMTADGITKKKQLPSLSGSCFFLIFTQKYTHTLQPSAKVCFIIKGRNKMITNTTDIIHSVEILIALAGFAILIFGIVHSTDRIDVLDRTKRKFFIAVGILFLIIGIVGYIVTTMM